jgi:serine/threonine protein phosphatase PrpC
MSEKQTGGPDAHEQKAASAQKPASAPPLDLVAAKLTDVGRARPHNEDYVDYYIPPDARQRARQGAIYVVADGMGGHQAGEVASQGAVELVIGQYYSDTTHDVGTSLVRAFRAANQQIHAQAQSDPSKGGMGTTLVAAVLLGRKVFVANVGDSRAYLINKQGITQITEDHSWVEEQVRAGLLTPEQARRHPQRNLVTRALGSKPAVEVDLFEGEIGAGDALLLCSDGLTGRVEDQELAAMVREHAPQQAAKLLVDLANERGGNDNITVLIVSAQEEPATVKAPILPPVPKKPDRSLPFIPILGGVAAILVLVLGGLGVKSLLDRRSTTPTSPVAVATTTTPTSEVPPTTEVVSTPAQIVSPTVEGPTAPVSPTSTLAPVVSPTTRPRNTPVPPPPSRTPKSTPKPLPTPRLEEPAEDAELRGEQTFRWSHSGSLPAGAAFEVLIWRPGDSQHNGAETPINALEQRINLDNVSFMAQQAGDYLWSVRVIGADGKPLSPEAPFRRFVYLGPQEGPGSPSTEPTTEPVQPEEPEQPADPCANFVCTKAKCCGSIQEQCCSKCPAGFCD